MTMHTPFDIDLHVAWHRDDLLREADAERLARQLPPRSTAIRAWLAAALSGLARRLDAHAPAQSLSRPSAAA